VPAIVTVGAQLMARALVTKLRIPDTAAQTRKSPVARSGRAEASCHDISNTWLAHGYSSSSLTTPATQSGLCGAMVILKGSPLSAGRARRESAATCGAALNDAPSYRVAEELIINLKTAKALGLTIPLPLRSSFWPSISFFSGCPGCSRYG
jgi:hypothetical protein